MSEWLRRLTRNQLGLPAQVRILLLSNFYLQQRHSDGSSQICQIFLVVVVLLLKVSSVRKVEPKDKGSSFLPITQSDITGGYKKSKVLAEP